MTVVNKSLLQIKNGRQKVGISFAGLGEMKQNEDGLVFFNKKDPVYFELLEYVFDGPIYNTVVESKQHRMSVTNEKNKSKRKAKLKKIIGGAILGTMVFPGPGTIAGAYAGGRSKDKKKDKNNSVTEDNIQYVKTKKLVEVPGTATLKFRNVTNSEEFSIQIICNSSKNAQLINFKTTKSKSASLVSNYKSNIEQIKEYKELLNLEIINQEEFNKKKVELLDL
ncbi:SHOCT domain-containing protein [Carnobacterium pleistocenium]|uniref:SHOCT domain-containing protein n=1 Tax=Carnobacterium pleistocenium TaxID=181073 RepID=UPI0005511B7B|nr:SHOCT domain-containing protein [Carnobacterium pleistocenium]